MMFDGFRSRCTTPARGRGRGRRQPRRTARPISRTLGCCVFSHSDSVVAAHEVADDEHRVVFAADLVHRHNMRMPQLRRRAGFAKEEVDFLGLQLPLARNLERHHAVELGVAAFHTVPKPPTPRRSISSNRPTCADRRRLGALSLAVNKAKRAAATRGKSRHSCGVSATTRQGLAQCGQRICRPNDPALCGERDVARSRLKGAAPDEFESSLACGSRSSIAARIREFARQARGGRR